MLTDKERAAPEEFIAAPLYTAEELKDSAARKQSAKFEAEASDRLGRQLEETVQEA